MLVVFATAVIGMLVASGIGVAVRSRLTGGPATFIDSVGGAAVNVISVLLLAWLIGSLVSFPSVSRQVSDSLVLRAVDKVMPHQVLYLPVFPPLAGLLGAGGIYSPIFSAIGAEGGLDLPAASKSVLHTRAAGIIDRSVVKIEGVAPSCSLKIEGSGFVVSPQHVLTNAHVVAGVTDGPRVFATDGASYASQVVFYDPQKDVAVLYVPGLRAAAMQFTGPPGYGASAIVAGYPLNNPLTLNPASVGSSIDAYGPNIYQNAGRAPADLPDSRHRPARQLRRPPGGARRAGIRHGVRGFHFRGQQRLRADGQRDCQRRAGRRAVHRTGFDRAVPALAGQA